MSQLILSLLHSTSVLSFYIEVVLALSVWLQLIYATIYTLCHKHIDTLIYILIISIQGVRKKRPSLYHNQSMVKSKLHSKSIILTTLDGQIVEPDDWISYLHNIYMTPWRRKIPLHFSGSRDNTYAGRKTTPHNSQINGFKQITYNLFFPNISDYGTSTVTLNLLEILHFTWYWLAFVFLYCHRTTTNHMLISVNRTMRLQMPFNNSGPDISNETWPDLRMTVST